MKRETCLRLRDATVWPSADAGRPALRDVSIEIRAGESVAILGPNGSGKSSLLKLITGELRPEWRNPAACELFDKARWTLAELRERIGVVMPEEAHRFDPEENAFDVVLSAFRAAYGRTDSMRFSRRERELASRAVDRTGVTSLIERPFGALSSGERRRFLIARALAPAPELLVLDEPSTALDFAAAATLTATLRDLMARGLAVILVTHHPGEIPPEIERVILLREGRVRADGPKREVLTSASLSETYGLPLRLRWSDGWIQARA